MKVRVIDTQGNFEGEHEQVDRVEIYTPATVYYFDNEQIVQFNTHDKCSTYVKEVCGVNVFVITKILAESVEELESIRDAINNINDRVIGLEK